MPLPTPAPTHRTQARWHAVPPASTRCSSAAPQLLRLASSAPAPCPAMPRPSPARASQVSGAAHPQPCGAEDAPAAAAVDGCRCCRPRWPLAGCCEAARQHCCGTLAACGSCFAQAAESAAGTGFQQAPVLLPVHRAQPLRPSLSLSRSLSLSCLCLLSVLLCSLVSGAPLRTLWLFVSASHSTALSAAFPLC